MELGGIRELREKEYTTNRKILRISYVPRAFCQDRIDDALEWISKILPDAGDRTAWLQFVSAGLTMERIKGLLIALGDGNNGKSALYEGLHHLLGVYYSYIGGGDMLQNNSDGTAMANLGSKRHIYYDDMDHKKGISESKCKQITGSKHIFARAIYSKVTQVLIFLFYHRNC